MIGSLLTARRRAQCRLAAAAVGCLLVLGLAPGPLRAQWVEAPGRGWLDVTAYHLDTRDVFGFDGERRTFFAEGRAVSTSVFLTAAAGLVPGVDAWVQAPYHRLRYDDAAGERLREGVGDTRFYLRGAPLEPLGIDVPLAIRGGVKLPVGDFEVRSDVIPLGDGQTDWELMLELGHSFHPMPFYVAGWAGYRWRERNRRSRVDFGDERFFLAQAGATVGRFGVEAVVEGWDGAPPTIEGVRAPSLERRMLQVTPTVTVAAGPGRFEAGARIPLAGRNLPAGTALVVGYFTGWSY